MRHFTFLLAILIAFVGCAPEGTKKSREATPKYEAAVSTVSPEATQVGLEIMEQGGNAFDAAIAVQFAMAVTYPRAGNLGGGGFAVLHTKDGQSDALDFREKAPLKSSKDMFLDEEGKVQKDKLLLGGLAGGVPGSVRGMMELHEKYGSLEWNKLVEPAVKLAREGFEISSFEATRLNNYQEDFKSVNPDSIPFLKDEWKEGDTLIQVKLAETLQLIADSGAQIYYEGSLAKAIANDIQSAGGIISEEDLNRYAAVYREPVIGTYRGLEVISMPPPSSGGIALIQLLNGAQKFAVHNWGHNSPKTLHIYTELMRRVYADRTTFLGDPEFYPVPTENLIEDNYLDDRFTAIDLEKKTNSSDIKAGKAARIESFETTHFSILDKWGNAVSITTTLNGNYGSKLWLPNVGFFLNNEMDDFSAKPGIPNQFGLIGGMANSIEPEKRMLSSMTPTIVTRQKEPILILGTPGGPTIITSVFQTILNVIEFQMDLEEAVNAPRMHHQWQPDLIYLEKGKFDEAVIDSLEVMGHEIYETPQLGTICAISISPSNETTAVSDSRRYISAAKVMKNE